MARQLLQLEWLDGLCVRPSKRAKHVRIKVVPPGKVEVVVPRGFDQRQLPGILARHEAWLTRTIEKVRSDYGGVTALIPPTNVRLAAIGREFQCEYRQADSSGWLLGDDRLLISHADGHGWRETLRNWLADQGRAHLVPWFARVSQEVGLPFARVTIRGQKTRWGSCSARKHISLNHGLLFLRPALVKYLFIHELCHTVHMNHSSRYWGLVEQLEPNYRRLDRELRDAATQVPPWARRD